MLLKKIWNSEIIYIFYRHETLKHCNIALRPYGPVRLVIKDVFQHHFFPSFKMNMSFILFYFHIYNITKKTYDLKIRDVPGELKKLSGM